MERQDIRTIFDNKKTNKYMKARHFLFMAAVAAFVASCGKGGGIPSFGDNEFPVVAISASNADMKSTYPATIKGVQDVEIRPKASGFITRVCVQEGQKVGVGQLLFVIDNEAAQAQVRQAQAAVNTAQSQVNTAKLTYENSKQLFEKNVVGKFELQATENTYQSAKAQLAQAQAALAGAREALNFCYVKSPAKGVVGNIPYKVGALVSGSIQQPLTTVSDNSSMEVYFSMNEKDILEMTKTAGSMSNAIAKMPPVKLQLTDGSLFNEEGRIHKVSGVIDPTTGAVQIIARFPNPQGLLKSGGSSSLIVPRASTDEILIPQECVLEVQDKHFVYLLGKDNKARYTEIKVDPQTNGTQYIVTEGVKAGDKYVTNGITKLTDGMDIVPITPERYQKKIEEQAKAMTAGDIIEATGQKGMLTAVLIGGAVAIAIIVLTFILGMKLGSWKAKRKMSK